MKRIRCVIVGLWSRIDAGALKTAFLGGVWERVLGGSRLRQNEGTESHLSLQILDGAFPVVLLILALLNIVSNTRFQAPPRFDGSGYALLAKSMGTDAPYHELSHPDNLRHTHFPPGYPLSLALVWKFTGISFVSAHLFSVACTTLAVLVFWIWFRALYPRDVANWLGLSIAINWTWGRVGGAIQSEGLFLLLSSLVVMGMCTNIERKLSKYVAMGLLLGFAVVTRHVGICLLAAVGLEWTLRRKFRYAVATLLSASVVIGPWLAWLTTSGRRTQAGLLRSGSVFELLGQQGLFYVRRIPDQLFGPLVEVATVFTRVPGLGVVATGFAVLVTSLIVLGWLGMLFEAKKRLAGLISLATMGILLIWPFQEAGRFLIPLVPLLAMGLVEGLGRMTGPPGPAEVSIGRYRRVAVLVFSLSIPYSAYAIVSHRVDGLERSHADFDAACRFLKDEAGRPGPVLSRHPGDVYWMAGRMGLEPSTDPALSASLIETYHVAYLLIDRERYARAELNPLVRFVADFPDRVSRVWESPGVEVYEVISSRPGVSALQK